MRIRKRQVPFLLPVPVSDPLLNLNRPPPSPVVVQLRHHNNRHQHDVVSCDAVSPRQPGGGPSPSAPASSSTADRPIGPRSSTGGSDFSQEEDKAEKKDPSELLLQDQDEGEMGNDTRKENISSAQAVSGFHLKLSPNSISPQVLVPPKKRSRGNSNSNASFDRDQNTSNKIGRPKNSSATTRSKKPGKNDDVDFYDQEAQESAKEVAVAKESSNSKKSSNKKAVGRGGALMEGSRCSRVNGRGWRCCQQTLVGYSLCEHHLGKGRLRSMTSVRSRSLAKAGTAAAVATSTATLTTSAAQIVVVPDNNELSVEGDIEDARDHDQHGDDHDHKIKKAMTAATTMTATTATNNGKKRMKLGMVKARSISSLLGQTDSSAISKADHNQYSK